METVTVDSNGEAVCPFCGYLQEIEDTNDEHFCEDCGENFYVEE